MRFLRPGFAGGIRGGIRGHDTGLRPWNETGEIGDSSLGENDVRGSPKFQSGVQASGVGAAGGR